MLTKMELADYYIDEYYRGAEYFDVVNKHGYAHRIWMFDRASLDAFLAEFVYDAD